MVVSRTASWIWAASEARDFLDKAGNHQARGEVYLILGYIQKTRKNYRKARDSFTKSTTSNDPRIRLQGYYESAGLAWKAGDYKAAADAYHAIIDENRPG